LTNHKSINYFKIKIKN